MRTFAIVIILLPSDRNVTKVSVTQRGHVLVPMPDESRDCCRWLLGQQDPGARRCPSLGSVHMTVAKSRRLHGFPSSNSGERVPWPAVLQEKTEGGKLNLATQPCLSEFLFAVTGVLWARKLWSGIHPTCLGMRAWAWVSQRKE